MSMRRFAEMALEENSRKGALRIAGNGIAVKGQKSIEAYP